MTSLHTRSICRFRLSSSTAWISNSRLLQLTRMAGTMPGYLRTVNLCDRTAAACCCSIVSAPLAVSTCAHSVAKVDQESTFALKASRVGVFLWITMRCLNFPARTLEPHRPLDAQQSLNAQLER